MKGRELLAILRSTYEAAKRRSPIRGRDGQRNRSRSQQWVDLLARQFQRKYPNSQSYRVFWLSNSENRAGFGLNELLFDIAVCRVSSAKSAIHDKELHLVTRSIWQVESEFAKNSRQSIFDFNKIVMGESDYKLFIAPIVAPMDEYLRVLATAAKSCSGTLFVAMVPHPGDWGRYRSTDIRLVRYRDGRWIHQLE